MHIRLARPTDAPLILSLALSEESHLIKDPARPSRWSLLRTFAATVMPPARPNRVWIGRERECRVMLEINPRRYVIAWDIVRLYAHGSCEDLLAPLFAAVTRDMQRRGVPRLFSRVDEEAAAHLRPHGFEPLAREVVLVGPGRAAPRDGGLPAGSRYRMPQDAWPLHQLEHEITPPLVRQLEGITSLDWSNGKHASEIVVEREGKIVAWIGWRSAQGSARPMGILIHQDYIGLGPELVHHALREMGPSRALARVRDYQVDTIGLLRDAGFEPVGEETLVVKYARVVPARARVPVARNVAGLPTIRAFRVPTPVPDRKVYTKVHV
ncbi:MAG TPA: hypothetical protein VFA78_06180 [Chloroflexota bacterium]|nr:hypothetical protein [Chloroflexota bacterium]